MDPYQSRGKVLTNFQHHWSMRVSLTIRQRGHWSMRISPEIRTDQWLPNLFESSGLHMHWFIECSSLCRPSCNYSIILGGRFGYFLIFLLGGGGKAGGVRAREKGRGAEGPGGYLPGFGGGGGLNFFSGPKFLPSVG